MADRPERVPADEVRQRMLDAGRAIALEAGTSLTVDRLRLEEVIARAGVPRSSVYRLWAYKDDYIDDLLIYMAGPGSWFTNSEVFDPETGFYYLRARYFNPAVGRFQTADPYEGTTSDPLTLNKYVYAANNPVNRIDPSGKNAEEDFFLTQTRIYIKDLAIKRQLAYEVCLDTSVFNLLTLYPYVVLDTFQFAAALENIEKGCRVLLLPLN